MFCMSQVKIVACFCFRHSVQHSNQHSVQYSIQYSVQHSVLHKNDGRFGDYGIGNQRWANQRHGFFSCSWPPTTELLTTRFGLLCWAIISSPYFGSQGILNAIYCFQKRIDPPLVDLSVFKAYKYHLSGQTIVKKSRIKIREKDNF